MFQKFSDYLYTFVVTYDLEINTKPHLNLIEITLKNNEFSA